VAAALATLLVAACGHAQVAQPPAPRPPPRGGRLLAVFPIQNLTGRDAPVAELTESLRAYFEARGFSLAPEQVVDEALARERIRNTTSIDARAAAALRSVGVEEVVVTSLDQYGRDGLAAIALTSRIATTDPAPHIVWIDRIAFAARDTPGLFGVGLLKTGPELERHALASLVYSAERGGIVGTPCPAEKRFEPRSSFRSPRLDRADRRILAVLPFSNDSTRRDAGEQFTLELTRQLVATGAFEVMEPGDVLTALLSYRLILDRGASTEAARTMGDQVGADLVVTGSVFEYEEPVVANGVPTVHFEASVIDVRSREVLWSSRSYVRGDDGVIAFGLGRLTSAAGVSCRAAHTVAAAIAGKRPRLAGSMAPPSTRIAAESRPVVNAFLESEKRP
jgi:TolB-like protein